jgi:WD40 repeat protein/pimeloyl-ACP methyl ester carboxylesterase
LEALNLPSAPPSHLVISIHGIRTFGQWQERLEKLLRAQEPSIVVRSYKIGYFSIAAFQIPFLRWMVRRRFTQYLLTEADRNWDRIDIVAHSFGTHIAAWTLHSLPENRLPLAIHTLILSGSVLRLNFPWLLLLERRVRRVVNECGTKDSVLLLSQWLVLLTGMAGRMGFQFVREGDDFRNRYFEFGHSGYFGKNAHDDSFMAQHWVPLLTGTGPIPTWDERRSSRWLGAEMWTATNLSEPIKIVLYLLLLLGLLHWRNLPRRRAQIAEQLAASRAIAVRAADMFREQDKYDPTISAIAAAESLRLNPTLDARANTLRDALHLIPAHTTFTSDGAAMNATAFSPDGRYMASGGRQGKLHILDVKSGHEVAQLPHAGDIDVIAFNRDGRFLAVGGALTANVIDLASRTTVATFTPLRRWNRHQKTGVPYDPGPRPAFLAIAFTPDAKRVLCATNEGVAYLFDAATGGQLSTVMGVTSSDAIAISPDVQTVAINSGNGVVQVFNVATARQLYRLNNLRRTRKMVFSPNGKYLAVGCFGFLRFFETSAGHELWRIPHGQEVTALGFDSSGAHLATGNLDGRLRLLRALDGFELWSFEESGPIQAVALSPSGRYLASASLTAMRAFEPSQKIEVSRINYPGTLYLDFSPDNRHIAAVGQVGLVLSELNNSHELARFRDQTAAIAYSFDTLGKRLLVGGVDGTAHLLEVSTQRTIWSRKEDSVISQVALSGDGQAAAIAVENVVKVIPTDGKPVFEIFSQPPFRTLHFSYDARNLLTMDDAGGAQIYWLDTGKRMANHPALQLPVKTVAFSPNGAFAVAVLDQDQAVGAPFAGIPVVLDSKTGKVTARLPHDGAIAVAVSADAKYIASGGVDKSARIFSAADESEVARITYSDEVVAVAFSPIAGRLRTVIRTRDGEIRIEEELLMPGDLISALCSSLLRNLTPAEWADYIGSPEYHKTCRSLP